MSKNKISIIVPVYNVERYIDACFDSIASQTYKGEIECILVDDCGQDNSTGILKQRIVDYHGPIEFSLLHHEHNKGLSVARNTGIRHATGDYLYFLDSDDYLMPNSVELLAEQLTKHPGVQVVQGSTKGHLEEWLKLNPTDIPEYSDDAYWIQSNWPTFFKTAWNKMVSRKLILEHALFFEEGLIHEDDIWNFMLAKQVKRIAFCFQPTYYYRSNQNGIMQGGQNSAASYLPVVSLLSKRISGLNPCREIEFLGNLIMTYHIAESYYIDNIPCRKFLIRHLFFVMKKRGCQKYSCWGLYSRIAYRVLQGLINRMIHKNTIFKHAF